MMSPLQEKEKSVNGSILSAIVMDFLPLQSLFR